MDVLTRKVLARFRADHDEKAPEQTQSWVEYLEDQNTPKPATEEAKNIAEHGTPGGSDQSIYNPYEYEDPSEKPKDPKGPPFVSEVPEEIDYGVFDHPKIFEEGGALQEWLKNQGQDMTEEEQEQNPAMSLTCKYSSVQNVLAHYVLSGVPIIVSESEFDDLFRVSKVAASLDDVVNKDYHYKNDLKINRAAQVSAVWTNKADQKQRESGLFIFKATSPGSTHGSHTVYLQFLRGEEEKAKEYPSYSEYPVLLACTCPSFLYHGAQHYAVQDGYMYLPAFKPVDVAPKPQNSYVMHTSPEYPGGRRYPGRGLNFRVCKHLLKVYEIVGKLKIETVYRKYPVSGPPSKLIDTKIWKDLMGFEFTEENIKQRLLSDKIDIPDYFKRENITQSVLDWFNDVWRPRNPSGKMKALRDIVEYPERIFFILLKEAFRQRALGQRVAPSLVNEGFRLMAQVVKAPDDKTPQDMHMDHIPSDLVGKGTALSPAGEPAVEPAEQAIKTVEPSTQEVEPAIKGAPSELAPSMIKKRLTPEEKREKLKVEQKKLRERGLKERARQTLKRFQEETVEPRKEKQRQLGKLPFFEE
jgi:hypothetical protein